MKFTTNIKCNGCVQSVRPYMDSLKEIKEWNVDLNSPDRIMTVEGNDLDAAKIILAIKAAGYKAERVE